MRTARTVTTLLLTVAVLLTARGASAAPTEDTGKRLAEIKGKIVDLEKNHRKELNRIQDALDKARESRDSDEVTKLNNELQGERDRFRKQAAAIQRKLKEKADATSLGQVIAEKRKARKKIETTIKQLRVELNQARQSGDTDAADKVKKRMKKAEAEFLAQLDKMMAKIKAKKVGS